MFRSRLLLTLATATLAAGTAAADVYKYKDEKGNIQYTDKPPSLPAERLNVQSQSTDMVAVQERATAEQQLFEKLPDGERRYLTSEELDTARASAKASMDVMCQ